MIVATIYCHLIIRVIFSGHIIKCAAYAKWMYTEWKQKTQIAGLHTSFCTLLLDVRSYVLIQSIPIVSTLIYTCINGLQKAQ